MELKQRKQITNSHIQYDGTQPRSSSSFVNDGSLKQRKQVNNNLPKFDSGTNGITGPYAPVNFVQAVRNYEPIIGPGTKISMGINNPMSPQYVANPILSRGPKMFVQTTSIQTIVKNLWLVDSLLEMPLTLVQL